MSKPLWVSCREIQDLHRLVAYRINPLLAEIASRYPMQPGRVTVWENYEEGARVAVRGSGDPLSGIVYALFSYRDMLVDGVIDVEEFRKRALQLALDARPLSGELYRDILRVLEASGCKVEVEQVALPYAEARLLGIRREGAAVEAWRTVGSHGRRLPRMPVQHVAWDYAGGKERGDAVDEWVETALSEEEEKASNRWMSALLGGLAALLVLLLMLVLAG